MKFFGRFTNKIDDEPSRETFVMNKKVYDIFDIESRMRNNKPLTGDEYKALEKYRRKLIANKVLQYIGLIFMITIVVLAIGCMLYNYSLFNVFGGDDTFADYWNGLQYKVSAGDVEAYMKATGVPINEPSIQYPIVDINTYNANAGAYNTYREFISSHKVQVSNSGSVVEGWLSIRELMRVAFHDGTSARAGFLVVGTWTIVVLFTVGLVLLVVFTCYTIYYNVQELHRFLRKLIPTKTKDTKQPEPEKKTEVVEVETPKKSTSKKKKKVDDDDIDEERINLLKQEIANEATQEASTQPIDVQNLSSMSDEELNKMLQS